MTLPNPQQALVLFEDVIRLRNQSPTPFTPEQETTFHAHCLSVADIANKIAIQTAYLNSEKAYILGLLHDCGRIKDEKTEQSFHGLAGYKYMLSLGYDEIARISLTHSFYQQNFSLQDYPYNPQHLKTCHDLIQNLTYDDYDRLIQLADCLNIFGYPCTIEQRYQDIIKRYQIAPSMVEPHIKSLHEIKTYFEQKCQTDIYTLIGAK